MIGGDTRISRAGVAQAVAEHIRELIFGGDLPFGSRVPQDKIAADLGVSRLPVREALITLESDGLVFTEPHRGTFVADVSPQDLRDHYSLCGVIHGLAANKAVQLMGEEEVSRLSAIHARMLAETDDDELYKLHWSFHQAINRAGGSRRLRAILHQLSHNLPASVFTSVSPRAIGGEATDAAILDALQRRDGPRAADLCRRHLEAEAELVVEQFAARGLWGASISNGGVQKAASRRTTS